MRSISFVGLGVVALLASASARPADACTAPRCWPGHFVPGNGTRVPANLPAIYWRPMRVLDPQGGSIADPRWVTLATTAAPTTPLPFTATRLANDDYLLVPDAPLVAGTRYLLTDATTCPEDSVLGPRVVFAVGPAAELPVGLGRLGIPRGGQFVRELAAGGTCSREAEVREVELVIDGSREAALWRDALHFETRVDGALWTPQRSIIEPLPPGASWFGRGRDIVYTVCGPPFDVTTLPAGLHRVEMRATLPGTALSLAAEPIDVLLECRAATPVDAGPATDVDAGGISGASSDGCSAAPSPPHAGLAMLLVAGLTGRRRGRRRR